MPTEETKIVIKEEDQTQQATRTIKRGVDEYNQSLNRTVNLKKQILQQDREIARERAAEARAMASVARSERVKQRPGRGWQEPGNFNEMSKAELIRSVASGETPMAAIPQELRNEIQVERKAYQTQQQRARDKILKKMHPLFEK